MFSVLDFFKNSFKSLWKVIFKKRAKILFLGLDNAGKTTLLHLLRDDKIIVHEPTGHTQNQEIVVDGVYFNAYDLGGHAAARRIWRREINGIVDGIVFIIDTTDHKRFEETQIELQRLLTDDKLQNTPFAIIGNKIDAKGAVSEIELKNLMGLGLKEEERIKVFMCSVVKRHNCIDPFIWLGSQI